MFGYLVNFRPTDFEIRIQPLDDRLALQEIMTLTHDADRDKAQLPAVELATSQFSEGRQEEFIAKRADIFFHQFVKGARWVGHFPSH